MIKQWFLNRLKKIIEHNHYPENALTVEECDKIGKCGSWTPCDLIAREYLNNGGGSSKGFLGITSSECVKCYDYMQDIKQELIEKHMINESATNNSGFTLWTCYNF